jgi:hypothetical protein
MKPKVYVETSVIGYLTSWPSGDLVIAARQKITRDWWRDAPAKYDLVISDVVVAEASTGDPQAVQDRLSAIHGLPVVSPSKEAQDLTNSLLAQGAVPVTEPEDAAHIALAAVNGIEYLVTWNFKHIANPSMRKRIDAVCMSAEYIAPTICTPEELSEGLP